MLCAQIKQKKAAKQSISHLGPELLELLSQSADLDKRIDEQKNLHIRLSISSLVSGSIELSDGFGEQIKGRIKLEVYPGQDSVQNARDMLIAAAAIAHAENLPKEFESWNTKFQVNLITRIHITMPVPKYWWPTLWLQLV